MMQNQRTWVKIKFEYYRFMFYHVCIINVSVLLADCWRRGTWRLQRSRSRGLNSCRERDGGSWRTQHINLNSSGRLNIQIYSFFTKKVIYGKVSMSVLNTKYLVLTYLLQEVKGWYLGEQQHILGAEEGPWLHPNRFPYAVVTPELQNSQHFDLHRLYCNPGWVVVISQPYHPHSVQFIKVNALIASAYVSCDKMFMQTYDMNVDRFRPMFSRGYVTLYHQNWDNENYLV